MKGCLLDQSLAAQAWQAGYIPRNLPDDDQSCCKSCSGMSTVALQVMSNDKECQRLPVHFQILVATNTWKLGCSRLGWLLNLLRV